MESDSENSEELEFRESFGDFLRRHREASGKSVDAIARTTRIQKRYLVAFEENDSSRFPEEAFTRGFLRSYAMEIGLEVEETISRYERFQRSLMPTQIKELKRPPSKFMDLDTNHNPFISSLKLKPIWIGLTGLIVLGFAIFLIKSFSQRSTKSSQLSPREVVVPQETVTPSIPAVNTITIAPSPSLPNVAPSVLTVKSLKAGVLNVRIDETPPQDLTLKAGETKTFNLTKEIEIKVSDRLQYEFLYNGKPIETSGNSIKLFNRNLFTTSTTP